jgi:hypothetical protein
MRPALRLRGGAAASDLAHVLGGRREPSRLMLEKLRSCLA